MNAEMIEWVRRHLEAGKVSSLSFLSNCEDYQWPAPGWAIKMGLETERERRMWILGHCPNCNSHQQLGPQDEVPYRYSCLDFDGEPPLYPYHRELGDRLFQCRFQAILIGGALVVRLVEKPDDAPPELLEQLRKEIYGAYETRLTKLGVLV